MLLMTSATSAIVRGHKHHEFFYQKELLIFDLLIISVQ